MSISIENCIRNDYGEYGYNGYLHYAGRLNEYNKQKGTSLKLQYDLEKRCFLLANSSGISNAEVNDFLKAPIPEKMFRLKLVARDVNQNKVLKFLIVTRDHEYEPGPLEGTVKYHAVALDETQFAK